MVGTAPHQPPLAQYPRAPPMSQTPAERRAFLILYAKARTEAATPISTPVAPAQLETAA